MERHTTQQRSNHHKISKLNQEYERHLDFITKLQTLLAQEEQYLHDCIVRKKRLLTQSSLASVH